MSSDLVGLLFSLVVLAWWAVPLIRARLAANAAKREECQRLGHQWGDSFVAMGTRMRNCKRCKKQEHHHADTDSWL